MVYEDLLGGGRECISIESQIASGHTKSIKEIGVPTYAAT